MRKGGYLSRRRIASGKDRHGAILDVKNGLLAICLRHLQLWIALREAEILSKRTLKAMAFNIGAFYSSAVSSGDTWQGQNASSPMSAISPHMKAAK